MMLPLRESRRPLVAIGIFFGVFASLYVLYNLRGSSKVINQQNPANEVIKDQKHRHIRVAVASVFEFHHDVYMSFASTIERVLNGTSRGRVEVYAKVPFFFQFQAIVEELGLYQHEYRDPEDLYSALRIVDENSIDLLILGTCEVDLREARSKALLEIWDNRPLERKFKLVCMVHHTKDLAWQPAITEWSRRNAIRIVTISEHVAVTYREKFDILADSPDPIVRSAGYENIPIDVHVPILSLPNLPERPTSRVLSNAVIQGTFSLARRDYVNIFKDLVASLKEDSKAWGYRPLKGEVSYLPDTSLSDLPFRLHILGSGELEVPIELKNIVQLKKDLAYKDFYDLMHQMDICVPAFGGDDYYQLQASSTFAMAMECNVPILVTKRIRKSYAYADDDRVVITRPAAMGEVAALKALRTANASTFLDAPMPNLRGTMRSAPFLQGAVDGMLRRGWQSTKEEFESFKLKLWIRNEDLAERMLHDL